MLRIFKFKFFNQVVKKSKLVKCYYSSSVIECLKNKAILTVGGSDAKDFLQGHITNDINLFENQQCKSIYSMILNHQGRVLYDVIIYSTSENFYIECDKSISDDLMKYLLRYKLRKKINITLDGNIFVWASYSKNLDLCKNDKLNIKESIISSDDPRLPNLCKRHLISSSIKNLELSDCEHISGFYEQLRYKNGISEGPNDLLNANCFPLESNLDFLNGVSFEKGCYVGQELTARTHHTGVIRKRLMPLLIKEPVSINPGSNVENMDGKNIGKIRGFNGIFGLGLLRIAEAMKSKLIFVKNGDTNVEATTYIPDWWLRDTDEIVKLTLNSLRKT